MRQSAEGPGYAVTPPQAYSDNATKRDASIAIDVRGHITGSLRIMTTGQRALKWRQRALRIDEAELKKEYDKSLEAIVPDGVEAHVDHFLGLSDPNAILMAVINLKGTVGTSTSKRLLLPAAFFESRQHTSFVSTEKRHESVDMGYPERLDESVSYHLPEGIAVEGAPKDSQVPWQGHAIYGFKTTTQPEALTVTRQIVTAFTLAKPQEYQDLRRFYQNVATTDEQQLVLKISTAPEQLARGN